MKVRCSRVLSLILAVSLIFQQAGFAQVAAQLNLSQFLGRFTPIDKFRPLHLRYFSFDSAQNRFNLLFDKSGLKNAKEEELRLQGKDLYKYFLIGITLPNESFWVNLRPDSKDKIIDDDLAQTDVGKIMLEADLQLKKDTALYTSPENPKGKEYWAKLYQKAQELFGTEAITIPTLTRPWIVPNEVVIRYTNTSAYIYKATLKVMLEQDYLKGSSAYSFKDERMKQLNEYASQLIRETIIPELNSEVNTSKRYAKLRQVYYSLTLAQWFKDHFSNGNSIYARMIDRKQLSGLTSKQEWSTSAYFNEYKKSFEQGEYNIKVPVSTIQGQVVRSYFSGGMNLSNAGAINHTSSPAAINAAASPLQPGFERALLRDAGFVGITANPDGETMPMISSPTAVSSSPISLVKAINAVHQQIWMDGLEFEWLQNGTFEKYVQEKIVTGVTTNPNLIKKYLEDLRVLDKVKQLAAQGKSEQDIYFEIVKDLAVTVIEIFRKHGVDGKFSVELDPTKADNETASVAEAVKWTDIDPQAIMVKVAATEAGYKIIEEITAAGRNVNATLIFSPEQYRKVAEAYIRGLKRAAAAGKDLSKIYSVASFFVSRWDVKFAKVIPDEYHGMFANAISIYAYNKIFKELFESADFKALQTKGALPQDFLLASTGSKAKDLKEKAGLSDELVAKYPADVYFTEVMGPNIVNTLPRGTVDFLTQKEFDGRKTVIENAAKAEEILAAMKVKGVDIESAGREIFAAGLDDFVKSFSGIQKTIAGIVAQAGKGASSPVNVAQVNDLVGRVKASREDSAAVLELHRIFNQMTTSTDSRESELARDFILESGSEIGAALKQFIEANLGQAFTKRFVLGEGVGENFGKGVLDQQHAEELFIMAIRLKLGPGVEVVRSQLKGGERAFLGLLPKGNETIVGLDIGGTNIRSALLNAGGIQGEINREQWAFKSDAAANREYVIQTIVRHVFQALRKRHDLSGVSISWAGPGEYEQGIISAPNIRGFKNFNLKAELKNRLGIDVRIMHDGAAGARAEYKKGALKGKAGVYVILGTGIGAGIVDYNGEPVYSNGFTDRGLGELGHHLIRTEHGYVYRPNENGSFSAISTGESYFEDRCAGPGLAIRFGEKVIQAFSASSPLSKKDEEIYALLDFKIRLRDAVGRASTYILAETLFGAGYNEDINNILTFKDAIGFLERRIQKIEETIVLLRGIGVKKEAEFKSLKFSPPYDYVAQKKVKMLEKEIDENSQAIKNWENMKRVINEEALPFVRAKAAEYAASSSPTVTNRDPEETTRKRIQAQGEIIAMTDALRQAIPDESVPQTDLFYLAVAIHNLDPHQTPVSLERFHPKIREIGLERLLEIAQRGRTSFIESGGKATSSPTTEAEQDIDVVSPDFTKPAAAEIINAKLYVNSSNWVSAKLSLEKAQRVYFEWIGKPHGRFEANRVEAIKRVAEVLLPDVMQELGRAAQPNFRLVNAIMLQIMSDLQGASENINWRDLALRERSGGVSKEGLAAILEARKLIYLKAEPSKDELVQALAALNRAIDEYRLTLNSESDGYQGVVNYVISNTLHSARQILEQLISEVPQDRSVRMKALWMADFMIFEAKVALWYAGEKIELYVPDDLLASSASSPTASISDFASDDSNSWTPIATIAKTLGITTVDELATVLVNTESLYGFDVTFKFDGAAIMVNIMRAHNFKRGSNFTEERKRDILRELREMGVTDSTLAVSSPTTSVRHRHQAMDQIQEEAVVSSPSQDPVGGIDFRYINMVTQAQMMKMQADFRMPDLKILKSIDITKEKAELKNMMAAGIIPSSSRMIEFISASYLRNPQDEGVIVSLVDYMKLEEESTVETEPEFKVFLSIIESGKVS